MSFNYRVIIRIIGIISVMIGTAMILPFIVAVIYHERTAGFAFLKSVLIALPIGLILLFFVRTESTTLKIRDGYIIAALCWFIASAYGAFPYMFSGAIPNYLEAYFESVSGFTTTGSTIIDDFSIMPKAIQFWRSFSHWLGAMGILILAISLLPALGIGGLRIASAEAPGPTVEKMSTKISDSARILYLMYLTFTIIEICLLKLGGLNLFDSLIHTFSSIGTGGLSNYKQGIAHFDNFYIEFVIIFFSIVASVNFVLYGLILKGRIKDFFKDSELRTFLMILFISALLITLNLWLSDTYDTLGESVRKGFFQATAFISTSGYAIADYTYWPSFSQMILFCLMLIGGCSASTCGSVKVIRVMIIFKLIIRGIYKRLHPNAVVPIKIGGKIISSDTVSKVSSFTILYFTVFIFSILVISLENHDMLTTISAAASTLSNTGMGMNLLGPNGNYSIFSLPIRLYMSVLMIAGRLELFTIIMLLSPSFWRAR
ncbi:TrkH family potassium uptake protein [Anoxybacterium hadale]|uniref:TrkH family potassium uptake protein n=1 Tax=Anoxybacterium hadale TaxID=3408580 RepID=A0ACD1A7P6_9FIRM|nr:TrkH family potassium uptake protein [Clostridiales bacterium]